MIRSVRAGFVVVATLLAACTPTQSGTAGGDSLPAAASSSAARTASEWPAAQRPSEDTITLPSVAALESESATRDTATDDDEVAAADAAAGGVTAPDAAARAAAAAEVNRAAATQRGAGLVAVGSGARGTEVEALQKRLDSLGFAPGPADGAYGPRTEAAVKAFQQITGLKKTGRANARTIAVLREYESDVEILEAGDKGNAVKRLQRRLAKGPLDPGPVDGSYGPQTVQAVWALEKLAGVPVDGNWGPLDDDAMQRLERGELAKPSAKHGKRWVEFDLSRQVMTVYDPGRSEPVLISHGSSGSGIPWKNEEHSGSSITPPGDFVISRRISGWRESSLDIGRLYNPLYFNGGIAFHGAQSVPLYPASHGCVRLPMHIAEYLPQELPNGTPVHVVP